MSDEKKPAAASVEEYIAGHPPERQEVLRRARETVRAAAPAATEKISWGMPTYWQGENLVHFAMGKSHLGFYPSPEAIVHFEQRLAGYKTSKGAVQFPLAQGVPYDLMAEITRWRVQQVSGE